MGDVVREYLDLSGSSAEWSEWKNVVDKFYVADEFIRIAMCGKYAELADCYVSVNEALKHAGASTGCHVDIDWIETEEFECDPTSLESLNSYDGILVPGGFGQRGTEGKLKSIEYCRIHDIPFLGICYGFQLSNVELARNVLGLKDAHTTECNSITPNPVIDLLPEQRGVEDLGGTMRLGSQPVALKPGTLAYKLYDSNLIHERHRHRWEVNPNYWSQLESAGAVFSGSTPDGRRKEILELPTNYFFLATQFHPEFKSRPWQPSPPYYGLVKASLDKKQRKPKPEFYKK
jgi:CTP synthase